MSSLLGYVRRVRAQPLDVQERELRRIEDGLEREYRPAEQLRLRLLLLLPETRLRNETRTRQLLRQMPKAGISEDYLGLAEAIEKAMTEQKRPATLPLEDVN